jgi:hypothetical protein
VITIPSTLSNDLTLEILKALITSGTVFLPLAGVVITFSLGSAKSHIESIRRDRLAVWVAQQQAIIKARIDNKPEIITELESRYGSVIEKYDARIDALAAEVRPLTSLSISLFVLVLAQILVSLRAMAEVSPRQAFPYLWVDVSISLLAIGLYGLAILVYLATGIGQGKDGE